jgi:hypothetical protein
MNEVKLSRQQALVLNALLEAGPKGISTWDLVHITLCLGHTARVTELRHHGFVVDSEVVDTKRNHHKYTLVSKPMGLILYPPSVTPAGSEYFKRQALTPSPFGQGEREPMTGAAPADSVSHEEPGTTCKDTHGTEVAPVKVQGGWVTPAPRKKPTKGQLDLL